jgi:hypothetical protein
MKFAISPAWERGDITFFLLALLRFFLSLFFAAADFASSVKKQTNANI